MHPFNFNRSFQQGFSQQAQHSGFPPQYSNHNQFNPSQQRQGFGPQQFNGYSNTLNPSFQGNAGNAPFYNQGPQQSFQRNNQPQTRQNYGQPSGFQGNYSQNFSRNVPNPSMGNGMSQNIQANGQHMPRNVQKPSFPSQNRPFQQFPRGSPPRNQAQNYNPQFEGQMVAFDPSNQANPADMFFNPMAMMEQIAQQIMGQFGGQMTGEEGEPIMMGGMIMMEPMMMMEGPDGVMMMMGGGGFPEAMMMMGGPEAMQMQEQFVSYGGPGRVEQFASREVGRLNEHGEFVSEKSNEYANSEGVKKQEVRQTLGEQERRIVREQRENEEERNEEYVNVPEGEEKKFEEKFKQALPSRTPVVQGNVRVENVRNSPGPGASLGELKNWYKEKYGRELNKGDRVFLVVIKILRVQFHRGREIGNREVPDFRGVAELPSALLRLLPVAIPQSPKDEPEEGGKDVFGLLGLSKGKRHGESARSLEVTKESFTYEELAEVKRFFPHGYHSTDKLGRPIYIERLGKLNIKGVFTVTTEERFKRYFIWQNENLIENILPSCSVLKGERVGYNFSIVDLDGASLSLISKQVYRIMQFITKVAQDNFPEILGQYSSSYLRVYLINCPKIVSVLWTAVKGLIDKRTRAKFKFLGSNFKEELLKFIDEENLPKFLGGKSDVDEYLVNVSGPWKMPAFASKPKLESEISVIDANFDIEKDLNENETLEEEKIKTVYKEGNFSLSEISPNRIRNGF